VIHAHHILAAVLTGVFVLVVTPGASAQDGPTLREAERAEEFRAAVVNSWGWRPDHGVSLTTTKYALGYVERYAGMGGVPTPGRTN
jgi:hypothetical protein